MAVRILSPLAALLTLGSLLAACSHSSSTGDDTDSADESSDALVTQADQGLVGSYRIDDPSSSIRGLVVKHPSRNYQFEKKIVFHLDVEPSAFPGLCPSGASSGAICLDARVDGTLKVRGRIVTLAASRPVNPLVKGVLGRYRFTHSSTALELTKVGAPSTNYAFAKASYCTSEYDCNIVTPDSMCLVQHACSAQRACSITQSDPSCDTSFSSVADLSDIGGTWTARGAAARSAQYQRLVLTESDRAQSSSTGTFIGSSPGAANRAGEFSSMPENPAIGFANLSLMPSGASIPDLLVVQGVKLDAQRKVQAMTVMRLQENQPGPGPSWVYERQP